MCNKIVKHVLCVCVCLGAEFFLQAETIPTFTATGTTTDIQTMTTTETQPTQDTARDFIRVPPYGGGG